MGRAGDILLRLHCLINVVSKVRVLMGDQVGERGKYAGRPGREDRRGRLGGLIGIFFCQLDSLVAVSMIHGFC